MEYFYDPKKVVDRIPEEYVDPIVVEEFVVAKKDGLFHIGQSYKEEVADTVFCKHCGGKEFNVGTGDYFTAIRCVTCHYEICIHDG